MDHNEARVRAVLDGLRGVLDGADPHGAVQSADARAIIAGAWDALYDVLADSTSSGASVELLTALHRLSGLDHALVAAGHADQREISHRLGDVLAQLEAAPCSVDDLVRLAPQLIADLGFDRAIISHIADGMWVSQAVFIADDPQWAQAINLVGQEQPQPLVPGLFETEVVRRRQAVVVTNVQHESRVHRPIADASRSTSYVAAPILSGSRVVGLLHADRYLQGRDIDVIDREVLSAFSHGLRLALSRATVAEQLQSASDALKSAAADADTALAGVHEVSLDISADHPEQLTGRPAPAVSTSLHDVLTRRELEVLKLVAEGRTNAGVAATLVISEGTVKQHVKHILRKLRVGNRAEAVSRLYQSADR
ncbi:helix-turn-helix transcriptional regulator [Mycolicibacterium komossense]|uniref:GAF domain-containing protein n=1 Tax=Mycolicibacterium komossense TaxID=1779 RepID=A0ABT3CKF4_9MYCO|nr:LuxR C-terminal-related transcriptional regulator [Mycolicibacterium komossense]MCV7230003.1 GAF domain-containing protein [Mycolicibacterium komossense]